MVKAGYVEYGIKKSSIIGVPQGGIASPILSNLILNELDQYIQGLLDENQNKTSGKRHTQRNPEYTKIDDQIQSISKVERRRRASGEELDSARKLRRAELIKKRAKIQSTIPSPNIAKFYYVRYADD